MTNDPNAVVEMYHPDVNKETPGIDPAQVTRKQFDDVWQPLGWKLVAPVTTTKEK